MAAHFGLDLSPSSIKVIEAEPAGKGYRLKAFGETPTPANLNSEVERDQVAVAEAIKKLAMDARVSTKNVVIALSESQVYSRVLELPPLSEGELANAIKFEAEQYVPIPLDQVQIEHVVLKVPPQGSENIKMEVLLVAVQKKAVERLERIINLAGLIPLALETEILAVLRAVSAQTEGAGVVIDIGRNSTDVAVLFDNSLKQVGAIGFGGEALTRSIATTLSLQLPQAEQYKRVYGLDSSQLEGKVASAMLETLEMIVTQVKRNLSFIRQKYPEAALRKVVLVGGTALMPELTVYLADQLGLEVSLGDPFYNFERDEHFPEPLAGVAPRFATAVGLAIREM